MMVIEFKEEDRSKIFGILLDNCGGFDSFSNKFRIIDNEERVLKKINMAGIKVKVMNRHKNLRGK